MKIWQMALLTAALAGAQDRADVQQFVAAHQRQIIGEFTELLSLPNVGTDKAGIRRNTEYLLAMLQRHGLKAELLETAGNPLVYAEKNVAGASRTLLFYIHYDGQPVDVPKWKQEGGPFRPMMRDGRMEDGGQDDYELHSRSTSSPTIGGCTRVRRPTTKRRLWLFAPRWMRPRASCAATSTW